MDDGEIEINGVTSTTKAGGKGRLPWQHQLRSQRRLQSFESCLVKESIACHMDLSTIKLAGIRQFTEAVIEAYHVLAEEIKNCREDGLDG